MDTKNTHKLVIVKNQIGNKSLILRGEKMYFKGIINLSKAKEIENLLGIKLKWWEKIHTIIYSALINIRVKKQIRRLLKIAKSKSK